MIKFKRAYDCISCIVVFIDETKIGIIITEKEWRGYTTSL